MDDDSFKENLISAATDGALLSEMYNGTLDVDCLNPQEQDLLSSVDYQLEGRSWIPYRDQTFDLADGSSSSNYTSRAVSNDCVHATSTIASDSIDFFSTLSLMILSSWDDFSSKFND